MIESLNCFEQSFSRNLDLQLRAQKEVRNRLLETQGMGDHCYVAAENLAKLSPEVM